MWVIRRLKSLGAGERELLSVLRAQVLSVLQLASPAWSTQMTLGHGDLGQASAGVLQLPALLYVGADVLLGGELPGSRDLDIRLD